MMRVWPMGSVDIIKKFGSVLIIVILGVMLALTFSKTPLSTITDILSGAGRVGSFDGEEIQPRIYLMAEDNCRQNMSAFGQIPEYILKNCIANQIRQLYVLPLLAHRLGVAPSEKFMQDELMKGAQEMYEAQKNAAPDDRLTVKEIYHKQLASFPMDIRLRMRAAQQAYEVISSMGEALPTARAEAAADSISMNARIIRFTTLDLTEKSGGNIQVTEEEIKAKHEKEQSIFEPAQRKSYESQKEFVKNRVLTEKRQLASAGLKQQLSQLGKDFKLEDIERITGKRASQVNIKLSQLKGVALPSGETVKLDGPEVLGALGGDGVKKIGPIQDGEATVYVEISGVQSVADAGLETRAQKIAEEKRNEAGRLYFELLLKKESERGRFKLKSEVKDTGPVSHPDDSF
ncbi:MAG TPA: hypothetical protein PKE49_08450 [Leptospiraceae bacterium]|nr:hypothetical protein [Leptospirales bacterium]HMX56540.1 hypothetical protein [Leptospiraceae bacterium]HMY45656.1 hypothetical protein [Leptospiraceae bacterium]HMZ36228.1 hypothetical protein [Leptospiraceae bacterium]HNE21552.1 hypothetical protein [Leptospiraceae bacterium]